MRGSERDTIEPSLPAHLARATGTTARAGTIASRVGYFMKRIVSDALMPSCPLAIRRTP